MFLSWKIPKEIIFMCVSVMDRNNRTWQDVTNEINISFNFYLNNQMWTGVNVSKFEISKTKNKTNDDWNVVTDQMM